jgi:hypothetical protein
MVAMEGFSLSPRTEVKNNDKEGNGIWRKDNSKGNEDGNIIPIISKESNQKVGELTVKITFSRKQTEKQRNSLINLRKLLNFNTPKTLE